MKIENEIADVICKWCEPEHLTCIELNPDMQKYLDKKPYTYTIGDFLKYETTEVNGFDRIIMNPPFSRQQDIDHVLHAYKHLNAGGILVSVISPTTFYRTNKKSVDFRNWLEECRAETIDLPEGAFKESGTMISAKVIKIMA